MSQSVNVLKFLLLSGVQTHSSAEWNYMLFMGHLTDKQNTHTSQLGWIEKKKKKKKIHQRIAMCVVVFFQFSID